MLVYQRVSTKKLLVIVPGILQKVESPLPVSTSAPGRAYWDWGMHRINSYVFSGNVGQYGIYKTHMSHTYNTYNLCVYIYNLDLQTSKYFCTYVPLG